ncbi:MAG: toprim domain-containing protein [Lachnospiraceae bacterium]|nr:toprim domain-containing protein [Lachnospiraceae bacterium]
MIDENTIKAAKAVNIYKILDEFNWHTDTTGTFILCPSPDHDDKHPSVVVNRADNYCRCFTCRGGDGSDFDTINLYRNLSEKVNQRVISFPEAVEAVLALDGMTLNNTAKGTWNNYQSTQNVGTGLYEKVLKNCKAITGYELNYLHQRGIFLYDSYVYNKQVYTVMNIEKELQATTDMHRIAELETIKQQGKLYKGISPILRANRINVLHNYFQGVNNIIYQIDYSYYDDEALQQTAQFLVDTERQMMIKKSLDNQHSKMSLGTTDFCWIAEGMGTKSGDVYICEGLEDSLSYTMNGYRTISLNSIGNVKSLIEYLNHAGWFIRKQRYIICLDHDEAGEKATQKLVNFFESYNQQCTRYPFSYAICNFPQQYHDINDYWVAKVFQ